MIEARVIARPKVPKPGLRRRPLPPADAEHIAQSENGSRLTMTDPFEISPDEVASMIDRLEYTDATVTEEDFGITIRPDVEPVQRPAGGDR